MKLLVISIVLLVLHIPFYGMEPIPENTFEYLPSDDYNFEEAAKSSCDIAKLLKQSYCSRGLAMDIANASAEEAKAASDAQDAAVKNASEKVKFLLGEKSLTAAFAANFLVDSKQTIAERLAKKIREVEAVVAHLKAALETTEANKESAREVLKMGDKHDATVQAVVDSMKKSIEDHDTLICQSEAELEEQTQKVAKAQELYDRLSQEVAEAKADYEKRKVVANRAVAAALEAQHKCSSLANVTATPGNCSCRIY